MMAPPSEIPDQADCATTLQTSSINHLAKLMQLASGLQRNSARQEETVQIRPAPTREVFPG
jgi:hypothetical protein